MKRRPNCTDEGWPATGRIPQILRMRSNGARSCLGRILPVALAVLFILAGCGLFHHDRTIGKGGGTATTSDKALSVTFASGQLAADTHVALSRDVDDAPPPVDGFAPLDQPFDIHLDKTATGGTVTAHYDLPAGIAVDTSKIVMFIEDSGQWRIVPATVDPTKRTVTGSWPHFSKGHTAWYDPAFKVGDAASWSWKKVKSGANWVGDRTADAAKAVVAGAVGLTGGTTDTARCSTDSKYWQITNSAGMTGCVEARDDQQRWPARVNDRYPYPLKVKLPAGTTAPGWTDLLDTHDPIDLVIAMIASRGDQRIVPAGKTVPLHLTGDAPAEVRLTATIDPYTVSARAVELIVAAVTAGITAESLAAARTTIATLESELETEFLTARKAGHTHYTLAEYINDTQSQNSLVQMRKRALRNATAAYAISQFFDLLDLGECLAAQVKTAAASTGSFAKQVSTGINLMINTCFHDYAEKAIRTTYRTTVALLDPATQAAQLEDPVKGMLSQVKTIAPVVGTGISEGLKTITLGGVDLTHAQVVLSRPGNRLTNVDWVQLAGPQLNCGSLDPELRKAQQYDITGDGIPDSFVTLDCYTGTDRYPSTLLVYDGTSSPQQPQLLGAPLTSNDDFYLFGKPCLKFSGRNVTVRGSRYRAADPPPAPTLRVTQTITWTGTAFTRGHTGVTDAPPGQLAFVDCS